ncbi:M56 family metallopeptidase [Adhaeribacter pallidiroseus]|uniref:Methicillin resistance mecR1 protein n=1 Tax=Adhaeribacter pallidiroseus TaxID=2072847 RepID=A0A369QPM1_9BACT|nr:M56 family metallopeptidase [Adhaeribacter pallidiroseus]RDC65197.1 Methicillin resistance mecR1 protein [Adhaeribacter pallidiroseus]
MNYLPAFLSPKLVEALGWTILHSLWQSALVAITLSVLLILLQRHSARFRYTVATTALFASLLIAGVTFVRTYQQTQPTVSLVMPDSQLQPALVAKPTSKTNTALTKANDAKPMLRGAILVNFKYYFSKHLPAVVLVWLLGMLTMLLKFLGGLAYVQRLKFQKKYALGSTWNTRLATMAQSLRVTQPVRLFESALVKTPLVIGYFKPIILLPFGTIAGLSSDQVEAILAHELAHIYRKDYLLNMLQALVEILFFFNPAVWWISDYVRVERENCCDDQAIAVCGNPVTYARALANLQTIAGSAPQLALAFAGKDGSLLGRIKRLVQQPRLRPTFSEGFMAACVLIVGLTVISVSAFAEFTAPAKAIKVTKPVVNKAGQPVPTPEVKPQTEDNLKASIYSITDSLTGKKSDLIIIKNKKGAITELYVNGQKIPKSEIVNFQKEIDVAMAGTRQAPRLPAAQVPQQLAKMKEVLKDLKPENESISFSFNGDLDDFGRLLLPPAPLAALTPPVPAPAPAPIAPIIPLTPPLPPKKPLEYLKTLDLPTNTLYIIDGKKHPGKSGKAALAKLKNENINSVQIYHAEAAQKQFGNEGKEGVVVVKTGKSDPNNFLLQEIGDDRTNRVEISREFMNDLRQEEHDGRMREHELRMREHEEQTRARMRENEERLKEHAIRMQEHEERAREHEIRAKEHEKRAAQFEKIKQELIKDKLIDANSKKLAIQINQEGFTINGVKQPAAVYDKYKKLFYPDKTDWSGSFSETINITED